MSGATRRAFLAGAAALAVAGAGGPLARRAFAQPAVPANPFTLGVASGYPLPTGIVLWTRLAPAPLEPGGGMPQDTCASRWEVATDDGWARWSSAASPRPRPSGRTRSTSRWTASSPAAGTGIASGPAARRARSAARARPRRRRAMPDRLRFAFASCQHYEQGFFAAYRHMLADDLDLVVHLGDYIYESSWGQQPRAQARRARAAHARRLPQPPRALQDRPRPPGRARRLPVDRHVGRPRGRQRLRRRPVAGARSARVVPRAPRRRVPRLLRAHAAPAVDASRSARTCASSRASLRPARAVPRARRPAVPLVPGVPARRPRRRQHRRGVRGPPATPARRCSARRRSAGSTRGSTARARAGT